MKPIVACLLMSACATSAPLELVVEAGAHPRRDALVEWAVPAGLEDAELRVAEVAADGSERTVAAQRAGDALAWLLDGELAAGASRRYRVFPGEPGPRALARAVTDPTGGVELRAAGAPFARFAAREPRVPAGLAPLLARSGYLHPLRAPSGRVVTGDFAPSHPHQHGVFHAWRRASLGGATLDFWNLHEGTGTVRCVAVDPPGAQPAFDALHARLEHVVLPRDEVVLTETWSARAWRSCGAHVLELALEQRRPADPSLVVEEFHYGGLGVRGALDWEDGGFAILTSEGGGRSADGERVRWCAISGSIGGPDGEEGIATLAVLAHPSNPRAPEPVRVHPDVPYFCFAPMRVGAFEIAPDSPYAARYRLVVTDGPPDAALLDAQWADFAAPLVARAE